MGVLTKGPIHIVVGKREVEERKVSIRCLGSRDQTATGLASPVVTKPDSALVALKDELKRCGARDTLTV